jgi:hypothetical protein
MPRHLLASFLLLPCCARPLRRQAKDRLGQVEKNISMKMALMIIEGALEQCARDGYRVSVVVVD